MSQGGDPSGPIDVDKRFDVDNTASGPVYFDEPQFPAPIFPRTEQPAPPEAESVDDAEPEVAPKAARSRRTVVVAAIALLLGIGLTLGMVALFTGSDSDAAAEVKPLSEAEMTEFLRQQYTLLPGAIDETWNNLSQNVQQAVGGYGEYSDYWRSVSSVQFSSPRLRDATSIAYTLVVYYKNGDVGTSDRWAQIGRQGDELIMQSFTVVSFHMDKHH